MTNKEIRTQIRTAILNGDATTSFPVGTSLLTIDRIVRLVRKRRSNKIVSINMQAGSLPNYDITYKE